MHHENLDPNMFNSPKRGASVEPRNGYQTKPERTPQGRISPNSEENSVKRNKPGKESTSNITNLLKEM